MSELKASNKAYGLIADYGGRQYWRGKNDDAGYDSPEERALLLYVADLESRATPKDASTQPVGEAVRGAVAALAAAISLLERGGKKAASSNTMFEMMLNDYRRALEEARSALATQATATQETK